MYRSQAVIDLTAIQSNLKYITAMLPETTGIMAVVKANGYGHGVLPVSRAAMKAGVKCLAVADVHEGVELREGGFTVPVLVLGGMLPALAEVSVKYDLTQAVYSVDMIDAMEEACKKYDKRAKIHIKVETGMNRLGVRPGAELQTILDRVQQSKSLVLEGIFSHFAVSEIPDKSFTAGQLETFNQAIRQCHDRGLHPLTHIGNSGAALEFAPAYLDFVRVGIAMYGLHPGGIVDPSLKPALSWVTNVVHVKTVHQGDTVSYGRIWESKGDRVIATLPVGYADGYKRLLGNKADVLIHGKRAPVVGRVCMDHVMADVTEIGNVSTGDEAVLIGTQNEETISANEIASLMDTISYEIVTTIGNRVERVYINE